ncbi:MAG TPA: cell division protein FtsL [Myxococcales bacterium]|nr:cell division protein FtsL [Myxococcales bacterium]
MNEETSAVRRNLERRALRDFATCTAACLLLASAMLLHAWVRTCVTERGYALSRLSAEHRELLSEHERLQLGAAELKSPQRIEELARTRLNMGPPPLDRVVVLVGGAVRPSLMTASR